MSNTLSFPNTFVDATDALASEVNANFTAVSTFLNSTKINDDNIQTSGISANSIAADAVTTVKILDANVTTAKLATNAVTTIKITDLNVTTGKIADLAITTGKLNDLAVTTAKLNDGAVTPAKLAALGQQTSSSSGTFTTSSGTFSDVTNMSVSITSTGRPIFIGVMSGSAVVQSKLTAGTANSLTLKLLRDSTDLSQYNVAISTGASTVPGGAIWHIDAPAAGTYTYKLQAKSDTGGSVNVDNCKLVAYEL